MSKNHSDFLKWQHVAPLSMERDDNLRVLSTFVTDARDQTTSGSLAYDEACALARRSYELGLRVGQQQVASARVLGIDYGIERGSVWTYDYANAAWRIEADPTSGSEITPDLMEITRLIARGSQ